MLTHDAIWSAIDRLAAAKGLSASGLARRAGLDATAFNRSKRNARDGRPRWPSTESISKVLEATGTTVAGFVAILEGGSGPPMMRVPVMSLAAAGGAGHFDAEGLPTGGGWDEMAFPAMDAPQAYALQVIGESLAPVYRDGNMLVVSPRADLRFGDRVVTRTAGGRLLVNQFARLSERKVELLSLAAGEPTLVLPAEGVSFVHRIVWASQ